MSEQLERRRGPFPYAQAWQVADDVQDLLKVVGIPFLVGSMARKRPSVEEIEFVLLPGEDWDLEKLNRMLSAGGYAGDRKRRTYRKDVSGIPVVIHVAHAPEEIGSMALAYTGDHLFTVALRAKAKRQGYRLDEYGIWKGRKAVLRSADEREFFDFLGVPWHWPEDRSLARRGELAKMVRKYLALPDTEPGSRRVAERVRDAVNSSAMPSAQDEETLQLLYEARFGKRKVRVAGLGASELLELGIAYGDVDPGDGEIPFEDRDGLWQALYEAATGREGTLESIAILVVGEQLQLWAVVDEGGQPAYYAVYTGEMPSPLIGWSAEDFLTQFAIWALEEPSGQAWLGPFAELPRA